MHILRNEPFGPVEIKNYTMSDMELRSGRSIGEGDEHGLAVSLAQSTVPTHPIDVITFASQESTSPPASNSVISPGLSGDSGTSTSIASDLNGVTLSPMPPGSLRDGDLQNALPGGGPVSVNLSMGSHGLGTSWPMSSAYHTVTIPRMPTLSLAPPGFAMGNTQPTSSGLSSIWSTSTHRATADAGNRVVFPPPISMADQGGLPTSISTVLPTGSRVTPVTTQVSLDAACRDVQAAMTSLGDVIRGAAPHNSGTGPRARVRVRRPEQREGNLDGERVRGALNRQRPHQN